MCQFSRGRKITYPDYWNLPVIEIIKCDNTYILHCEPGKLKDRQLPHVWPTLFKPCNVHLGVGKYTQSQLALDKFIKRYL